MLDSFPHLEFKLTGRSKASSRKLPLLPCLGNGGFTLLELLVVMAIISILAATTGLAISSLMTAGRLSKATSDIASTMQLARSYAMSKNTYVYLGIQEVDAMNPTPSDGFGRLVIAVIASKAGTRATNFSSGLVGLGKVQVLEGVHLARVDSLKTDGNMSRRPADLDLGSDDSKSQAPFTWPFEGAPQYRFSRVLEFDPQGVVRVQTNAAGSSSVVPYIEIALVSAKGNTVSSTSSNQAAIQINGITGIIRVFRP